MEKQRRLRTWLYNIVDSGRIENLEWLDKENKIFKIPWKHESRNDWDPSHAQIFTEWAKFTGKYREGVDKPDHKMFKTRLRCAFNKAPDIEEIVDLRKYKGATPYRVYRLLPYDKKVPYKKTTYVGEKPVYGGVGVEPLAVSQPPIMVEEMCETDNKLNTIELLKAVEMEREQQQKIEVETKKSLAEIQPVESEVAALSISGGAECKVKKPASESEVKEEAVAQSLILLQSTRYRCALLKNLFELQKSGILCDLLLKVQGGHVIPVHANVLCASSPFFKQKVDHWEVGHSGDTEGGCMVITFDEVSFDILNSIIQFIYMGEFEVSRPVLPEIQRAASAMKLDDLCILCEHVLKALRGSLIDEKNNKPILPKQVPLILPGEQYPKAKSGPPTSFAMSVVSQEKSGLVQSHATTSRTGSVTTTRSLSNSTRFAVPARPMGKIITSIPPPPYEHKSPTSPRGGLPSPTPAPPTQQRQPALLIPKSVIESPCITGSDKVNSWHIPQYASEGVKQGAEVLSGQQNPLDVLCQAVEETMHSESQSEGEEPITATVRNGVRRPGMSNQLVKSIPPVHLTEISSEPSTPDDTDMLAPSLTVAVSQAVNNIFSSTDSVVSSEAAMRPSTQPALVIPNSVIQDTTNTARKPHMMVKSVHDKAASDTHMTQQTERRVTKLVNEEQAKKMAADAVSDEHIQTIIKRIKSKTGEDSPAIKGDKRDWEKTDGSPRKRVKTRHSSKEKKDKQAVVVIEDKQLVESKSSSMPPLPGETDQPAYQCSECHRTDCTCKPSEETGVDKYECDLCKQQFTLKSNLAEHLESCGVAPVVLDHICDQCGKMFAEDAELHNHIKKHEKSKNLTCKVCKKTCKNKMLLRFHLEMHASRKLTLSCHECGKHFMTSKKLKAHVQMHVNRIQKKEHGKARKAPRKSDPVGGSDEEHEGGEAVERKEGVDCEGEDSVTSSSTTVHMPSVQELNEGLKQVMQGTVDTEDDGSIDVKVPTQQSTKKVGEQNRTQSRICLMCNKEFPDHVKKMVHMMCHFKFHADSNKAICQICSLAVDKRDIVTHEQSHTGEGEQQQQPLQCPHCEGAFTDSSELNTHVLEDHPQRETVTKVLQCKRCTATFSSTDALREHQLSHVVRPQRSSVKKVSDEVLSQKSELKKPFCSRCDDKLIPCRFCDKTFKDYSGRSQHEKKVHNRGPLARGRRKGFKPAHISAQQQPEVKERSSRPPPLVNLNLLSDHVKRQFFPALVSNTEKSYAGEEEDLSTMVASKGHQSAEHGPQDERPFELMYRQPSQYNPYMRYPAPHPPLELLSHLTASKNNPLGNAIPRSAAFMPSPSGYAAIQEAEPGEILSPAHHARLATARGNSGVGHQQQLMFSDAPSSRRVETVMAAAGGHRLLQQPQFSSTTTGLARVGGQLKKSSIVAPQVRKPPTTTGGPEDPVKPRYPQLPKKRPIDPKYLSHDHVTERREYGDTPKILFSEKNRDADSYSRYQTASNTMV